MANKKKKVLVIDSELNDDWMKSLPGYQNELAIHAELAKRYEQMKGKKKNDGDTDKGKASSGKT